MYERGQATNQRLPGLGWSVEKLPGLVKNSESWAARQSSLSEGACGPAGNRVSGCEAASVISVPSDQKFCACGVNSANTHRVRQGRMWEVAGAQPPLYQEGVCGGRGLVQVEWQLKASRPTRSRWQLVHPREEKLAHGQMLPRLSFRQEGWGPVPFVQ